LSNSASDGVIFIDLAKNSILNEEMRRKSQHTLFYSDILVSEYRGEATIMLRNTYQSRHNFKDRYKNVECHYCHKKGHVGS